jgi:Cupin superfamily protein
MPELELSSILAPLEEGDFLRTVLGSRHLHVAGSPDRFAALFSWNTLNRTLSYGGLTWTRLSVTKAGREVPRDLLWTDLSDRIPRLRFDELNTLLRDGAALTVERIDELHEPMARFVERMERRLEVPAEAAIRATFGDQPESALRWNAHDVIVLQIGGKKCWKIHGMTRRFPTALDAPDKPAGEPLCVESMREGDLLYLPRGWWYSVGPTHEPTLDLAINFRNPTGMDLVGRIMLGLHRIEFMRTDYPRFAGPDDRSRYLTALRSTIVNAVNEQGLTLDYLKDIWGLTESRIAFGLPGSARFDNLSSARDHVIVPLTRFPHPDLFVEVNEDVVEVVQGGKANLLDKLGARILKDSLESPPATVGALVDRLDGSASREQVFASLSALVQQNLIVLKEACTG